MTRWLLRRTAAALAVAATVVTIVFVAVHLAPGTPFLPPADRPFDPAREAALRARFGLDRPLAVQYVRYVAALVRGDLGESFARRRPVAEMLARAVPNTLLLAIAALAVDVILGLALAVYQATRPGTRADAAVGAVTLGLYSLPTFWFGLMLLLVFGERLHWLPVGGVVDPALHDTLPALGRLLDRLRHLALPALALGLVGAAGTARFERAAILDALGEEFVRTARARGLSDGRVLGHALRNAVLPLATLLGLALPFLLTGSVVVETVFAWPGMGKLAADAVAGRDYPVVTAAALVSSLLVVAGSLGADALYAALDPRIREARGR